MDYQECEKMAILALRFRREKVTDENIGIVIGYILTANHKFNKNIGNEFGFRKMYIDFAIKTIKTKKKKEHLKNTVYIENYDNLSSNLQYKHFFNDIFWEDLKTILTNREYEVIFHRIQNRKTFKEIGNDLGLSHETARNILKLAYRKVKKCYA